MFPRSGGGTKQEHAPSYHEGTHIALEAHYERYVKSYDCLQDEGYVHLTVNHSLNFVDRDTQELYTENREHMVVSKTKFTLYKTNERSLRQLFN